MAHFDAWTVPKALFSELVISLLPVHDGYKMAAESKQKFREKPESKIKMF